MSKVQKERADVLLMGQVSPPFYGQAVVTDMLFKHHWESLNVELLRMEYSKHIDDVSSFSFRKIFKLFRLVFCSWYIWLVRRPSVLYYLPSGPRKVPIIRDVIFLSLVKPFFKKVVLKSLRNNAPFSVQLIA